MGMNAWVSPEYETNTPSRHVAQAAGDLLTTSDWRRDPAFNKLKSTSLLAVGDSFLVAMTGITSSTFVGLSLNFFFHYSHSEKPERFPAYL